MRVIRLIVISILSLLILSATPCAAQTIFKLKPMALTNGWTVTGSITTDGTVGLLAPVNIVAWNLKVMQTSDLVWTEKDSNDGNISGVSTDGKKIRVATSPDGFTDGGTLYVGRGGGGGRIPTNAVMADFTQLSYNLGYGYGGIAGWQDEVGGLNYVGLNRKNNTQFVAASAQVGKPNVFRIIVPPILTGQIVMTMSGTITTDGTIGPLAPSNFVAWNITARTQDITYYSNANSTPLAVTGVSSDGTKITVDHAGGQFLIGIGGMRPTFITFADFTDPTMPDGFANYYTGSFGVMGEKTPLLGPKAKSYAVAHQ
jgi:uncharacterized membrane protein